MCVQGWLPTPRGLAGGSGQPPTTTRQKSLLLGHRGLVLELKVTLPALARIHTPAVPTSEPPASARGFPAGRGLRGAQSFLLRELSSSSTSGKAAPRGWCPGRARGAAGPPYKLDLGEDGQGDALLGCDQGGEGEAEPKSHPQRKGCERRDRKEGQERPAPVTCAVNAFLPRPSSSDSLSDPRRKHAINTQLTKMPRGQPPPDLPVEQTASDPRCQHSPGPAPHPGVALLPKWVSATPGQPLQTACRAGGVSGQ